MRTSGWTYRFKTFMSYKVKRLFDLINDIVLSSKDADIPVGARMGSDLPTYRQERLKLQNKSTMLETRDK